MRRAARTDANHAEIADAFRKLGCSVQSLHRVGEGVPDLLVAKNLMTAVVEVKTEKGKETEAQRKWAQSWQGYRFLVNKVEDVPKVAEYLARHF